MCAPPPKKKLPPRCHCHLLPLTPTLNAIILMIIYGVVLFSSTECWETRSESLLGKKYRIPGITALSNFSIGAYFMCQQSLDKLEEEKACDADGEKSLVAVLYK